LEAHPVSLAKNLLTIGFDPEFEDHLSLVDNAHNHTLLQTKLTELGLAGTQIKFVKAPRPTGWIPGAITAPAPATPGAPAAERQEKAPTASFDKNDFKNDPLIKKALEIFKGQIVEVRS